MDIDVDSLKYAELQKHAKKLGLKANLKVSEKKTHKQPGTTSSKLTCA